MKEVQLWPGSAPGALGTDPSDIPTLSFVSDDQPSKHDPFFIVCPGGGYGGLADYEGRPVSEWLESVGVRSAVLKYRLGPRYHHPIELGDAARAVRHVRTNAASIGVDPARIGVLGFSAGGHLASTISTHWERGQTGATDPVDRTSSRPDASMLLYPVIRLSAPYGHAGSRTNLLGSSPDPQIVRSLDNDEFVSLETPPTFLCHGADDGVVPVQNSLLYAKALADHKVHFSIHVPPHGPHGFGLGTPGSDQDWRAVGEKWLRTIGF
jgi:acetyl esterase/lipase